MIFNNQILKFRYFKIKYHLILNSYNVKYLTMVFNIKALWKINIYMEKYIRKDIIIHLKAIIIKVKEKSENFYPMIIYNMKELLKIINFMV